MQGGGEERGGGEGGGGGLREERWGKKGERVDKSRPMWELRLEEGGKVEAVSLRIKRRRERRRMTSGSERVFSRRMMSR